MHDGHAQIEKTPDTNSSQVEISRWWLQPSDGIHSSQQIISIQNHLEAAPSEDLLEQSRTANGLQTNQPTKHTHKTSADTAV